MRFLFCDSGFSPKEVDYMYMEEYKTAKTLGFVCSLISFEALKTGAIERALKYVRASELKTNAVYRGWMLKPEQYTLLYEALVAKNIYLINSPEAYRFCHYLPESYETIKDFTPKTTFKALTKPYSIDDFKTCLTGFGSQAIVLKDYVKSQKHYWEEACFIPNAADLNHVDRVIKKFLELQDSDLNEGLVFRAFEALEALTHHSESGMPLTKEFRVFIKNGAVHAVFQYWDEGDYEGVEAVLEPFLEVIQKIKSNFFTMDIAKKENGDWIIVELGDGQVAGLPDNADKEAFYNQFN